MACVTIGTLRALNELNYTIKEKWKKWKVDDQVVGMEQTYDYGLKFITVKGVGHMVPEDNPKAAKIILDNYIKFIKEGYTPEPEKEDKENSFPVWAIILISVVGSLIIIGIVVIILIKIKRKASIDDIDDNGKLLAEMS